MIIRNYSGVICIQDIVSCADLKILQNNISNYDFLPSVADQSFFAKASKSSHDIILSTNCTIKKIIEQTYDCKIYDEDCATINKYLPGWSLEPHDDSGPTNSGRDSTDFSSILYFNHNFVGGNLRFIEKDIFIQPKAGMVVISPATSDYLHEVTKLVSGQRYTATVFWQKNNIYKPI